MTDAVVFAFLVLCAPVAIGVLLVALPLGPRGRWLLGGILAAWFALTAMTPLPRFGVVPGALFGILVPVIVVSVFMVASREARRVIAGASVALLVGLHVTRLIGGAFVVAHAEGRLADPFASIAGWGDVLAAVTAVGAAIIAWRARPGWEVWVLGWNVIGFADFVSAIALGTLSQPGLPFRVFMEAPGTALLGTLPWRFIPNFFVPLYLMIHVALFIRLVPAVGRFNLRHRPGHVSGRSNRADRVPTRISTMTKLTDA